MAVHHVSEATVFETLGVLGGLGPLASAEFVKTIYQCRVAAREQDAPRVLRYSDPTFPDRTEAISAGRDEELLARLIEALRWFERQDVADVIICCVTIHYLLPRMPAALRARVVPLTNVILERVIQRRRRHLLLCTEGTCDSGLFERHPQWAAARAWMVMPTAEDQREVHALIYRIKQHGAQPDMWRRIEAMMARHHVDACIAGCTELHLLSRLAGEGGEFGEAGAAVGAAACWLDPLTLVARDLTRPRGERGPSWRRPAARR